jgi:hypothetical protein
VCVCEPQSSGTEATCLMAFMLRMSKIWMPSNPVHGEVTGAHAAPVGFPFWLTEVHWSVICGESTERNTRLL